MAQTTNKSLRRQVAAPAGWGDDIGVLEDVGTGQTAIRLFQKMRYDATGMSMYHALAFPVRSVTWSVNGGESEADKKAIWLVEDVLKHMDGTFSDLITQVCSFFWAGFSLFEMIPKRREDGYIGLDKVLMVPQGSIQDWKRKPNGSLDAAIQASNPDLLYLDYCLFFRTDKGSDNPWGESIYKAAARPYKFRRRLEIKEGIGLTRRWAGFPMMSLPDGATFDHEVAEDEISDEARAREVIEAVYRDRMMGLVKPHDWDFQLGGPEGNIDATMGDTIMRKDMEMARAILGQFLLQGLRKVGTQALAGTLLDIFMYAIDAYLEIIAQELNKYLISYLFSYNIIEGMETQPFFVYTAPRQMALAQVGQFVMSLVDSGIDVTDKATESFLRSLVPGMPTEPNPNSGVRAAMPTGDEPETDDADEEEDADENQNAGIEKASRYAVSAENKPARYRAVADGNVEAQRALIEGWTASTGDALADADPDGDVAAMLDDLILVALLAFRERSVLDISAAFWLGFGRPAGGRGALTRLDQEIRVADAWIGYGEGDRLVRVNPAGKPTLFGDIAGELEGQLAAIILLLKQGRREEIMQLVTDTVKSATRNFSRIDQYAGHVWHATWAGAVEREMDAGAVDPVRWVMDPFAIHCSECPEFAGSYDNLRELLNFTGHILPGQGTECDGYCRCHIEVLRGGMWVWL